jgi:hypothetical protein
MGAPGVFVPASVATGRGGGPPYTATSPRGSLLLHAASASAVASAIATTGDAQKGHLDSWVRRCRAHPRQGTSIPRAYHLHIQRRCSS